MTFAAVLLIAAIHPLEREGFEHLYNLEYEEAAVVFERLAKEEPSSPAGPHYLASTLWLEELARRGALSGETFQSSRYWTRTRKESFPPGLRSRFEAEVARALSRSRARLATSSRNLEALYFLGATESVVSGFEATVRHRYFAAYLAGRRARNHHRRLMELAPSFADAYLVPGIYEYTVATLPRSIKFLAFLIGIQGSKEKGVSYLKKAAAEGERARWDGKLLLAVIHEREKRYREALALLQETESRFPKNALLPLERGSVYLLMKDWARARALFEETLGRQERGVAHYVRVSRAVVLLRLGESFLFEGRFEEAIARFDRALSLPETPVEAKALLHLRRGQGWDGREQRGRAREDYLATIRINADRPSRQAAEQYLERPFRLAR